METYSWELEINKWGENIEFNFLKKSTIVENYEASFANITSGVIMALFKNSVRWMVQVLWRVQEQSFCLLLEKRMMKIYLKWCTVILCGTKDIKGL